MTNSTTVLRRALAGLALGAAICTAPAASAALLDLGHPVLPGFLADNIGGSDRSVVFDVDQDFSISSAGIRFDPLPNGAETIEVEIFAMQLTGGVGTRGALLASAQANVADGGLQFYDIPILFDFEAGNRYDVAFNSIVPPEWGFGLNDMEFYNFNFPDPAYSVDGVLTVLDGGFGGGYGNTVMPHIRFDGEVRIPEPGTLALLGLGLLGLAARRRLTA